MCKSLIRLLESNVLDAELRDAVVKFFVNMKQVTKMRLDIQDCMSKNIVFWEFSGCPSSPEWQRRVDNLSVEYQNWVQVVNLLLSAHSGTQLDSMTTSIQYIMKLNMLILMLMVYVVGSKCYDGSDLLVRLLRNTYSHCRHVAICLCNRVVKNRQNDFAEIPYQAAPGGESGSWRRQRNAHYGLIPALLPLATTVP